MNWFQVVWALNRLYFVRVFLLTGRKVCEWNGEKRRQCCGCKWRVGNLVSVKGHRDIIRGPYKIINLKISLPFVSPQCVNISATCTPRPVWHRLSSESKKKSADGRMENKLKGKYFVKEIVYFYIDNGPLSALWQFPGCHKWEKGLHQLHQPAN